MDTASVDFSDRIRNTRRKGKIEKNTPDKYLHLHTSDRQGVEYSHTP